MNAIQAILLLSCMLTLIAIAYMIVQVAIIPEVPGERVAVVAGFGGSALTIVGQIAFNIMKDKK